jgi:hypothetical protein
MSDISADLKHIYSILKRVEEKSKTLRWAKDRPWKRSTHIWYEGALLVIDLHDLNTKLAKESIEHCLDTIKKFETGALCFVTGIGKNSAGNLAKNREMVCKLLSKRAKKNEEWEVHSHGMGRTVLIFNKEKAPSSATGRISTELKVGMVLFLFLLVLSSLHNCWPQ